MPKGKFRLFYEDESGQAIACAQVKYRLIDAMLNKVIAEGLTDAKGETITVNSAAAGTNSSQPFVNGTPSFPGQQDISSSGFYIEVYNFGGKKFESPELHKKSKDAVTIYLSRDLVSTAVTTHSLRLRPFHQVRLLTKATQVGIAKAKFVAYTIDKDGKTVRARDDADGVINGNTDAKGFTGRIYSERKLKFKFTLPSTTITQDSAMLAPNVTGQQAVYDQVEVKGQLAVTSPAAGNAAYVNGKTSMPVIVNAEAEELIIVPQKDWEEFEAISGYLEGVMVTMHQAKLDLSHALESKDNTTIANAEKNLGHAEDKVKAMLNKDFKKLADLQEVITFESYNKGKDKGNEMGVRRRYIPKAKYEKLKEQRLKGIPYKIDIKAKPDVKIKGSTIAGVSQESKLKSKDLDYGKLKDSFAKITKEYKAKKEFFNKSTVYDLNPLHIGDLEIAGGELSKALQYGDTVELEGAAQWMRFVGSAGLNGELNYNPTKGKVVAQLQGNLQAKAIGWEGKGTARYAIPSLNGWMMRNEAIDLGAIRFVIEGELYGFAGAKGTLSGSLGICIDTKSKQVTRAAPVSGNLSDQGRQPRFEPVALNVKPPENINGLQLNAEVFVGVEGGAKLKGSLQWLPPEAKDFSAFAEIAGDIAGNAGAGASAQLSIYYQAGKFRVKASARLCWGIGAKGAVEFMIDTGKMIEFVKWVYHQLMNAGFKVLIYIAEEAFNSLSQLLFTVIAKDSDVGQWLVSEVNDINNMFNKLLESYDLAKSRDELANNVNRKPKWLEWATPETRGMLLYQITRHSKFSHARDLPTLKIDGIDPEVHYMPIHKEAILNIMRTVRTAPEWDNVMQHMSAKGTKSAQDAGKNEGDVLRVLNNGLSLNANLPSVFSKVNQSVSLPTDLDNYYLQEYFKLRKGLLQQFPKGYIIAMNGTPRFAELASLDGAIHPEFGQNTMVAEIHQDQLPGEGVVMMA